MIRLAIFDLAGTTVQDDDGVANALIAGLAEHGHAVSRADATTVMGIPKPLAIKELIQPATPDEVDAMHASFRAHMLRHYERSPDIREVNGAAEVFRQLQAASIRVAVDTGFDREITDVLLARLGWGDLVDDSITSDEVPRGRPHPDMVFALMARAGITDASSVAKIGDTPADLLEGYQARCGLNIGVTEGTHTREQLGEHPHTQLVPSIREALPILLASANP